jgi:hypothetical protein
MAKSGPIRTCGQLELALVYDGKLDVSKALAE